MNTCTQWIVRNCIAVLGFGLFLINSAQAQQTVLATPLDSLSLEALLEVEIITASKSAEKIENAPAVVSVITADEIEGYGAISLYEVLDRAASLYFSSLYNTGKNGLTIRGDNTGSYNTHILMLMDGRPMRESLHGGHNNALYITFPLSTIERIEIVRGPGSVLYGTGAYVGVINIITKKNSPESVRLTGRYGTFNTVNSELAAATTLGKLKLAANAFFLNNTGWDFTARGEGDIIRNRANTRDSIIRTPTTKKFADFGYGANVRASYEGLTIGAMYGFSNQGSWGRQPDWRNRPLDFLQENVRGMVDIGYVHTFSDVWTSSLNATYNHEQWRMRHPSDSTKDDLIRAFSNDVLVEWTNFLKPTQNLNIIVGGLVNHVTGQVLQPDLDLKGATFNIYRQTNPTPFPALPPYALTFFGAYLQADYTPTSWLKLIVGGQVNKAPEIPLDIVPRLGAIVTLTDNLKAKVLYGQAFRTPSIFERNVWTPPVTAGNSLLRPERIATLEGQLIYSQNTFELALTYFRSQQNDLIFRSAPTDSLVVVEFPVGSGRRVSIPQYINRGSQVSQGVEFEGRFVFSKELTANASVSYQTSIDDQNQVDFMGMPKLMAKLGIHYKPLPGLSLGVFHSYFGVGGDTKAYDRNGNPVTLIANPEAEAFHFLTANITANLARIFAMQTIQTLELSLYGSNLLDAQVWNPETARRRINTIPGRPGRAIYLGLSIGL